MTIERTEISQTVFKYVARNSHTDISKVKPETMLFREGIFDSMAFILLIEFLEDTFFINIKDSDLIEENFESISAITGFIQRKKDSVPI